MCGRYFSTMPPEFIARLYGTVNPLPNDPPRCNAAPTQDVLAVRFNPETRQRSLDLLRWGLIPHWSKDAGIGAKLINARAESIAEKPFFRAAFKKRRCLLPADGFYEWAKDSRPKQPYVVRFKNGASFAFAGLWENWRNPDGRWVRSCTIIATDANALLAPIHDRMPAILDAADHAKWLGEEPAEPPEPRALLKPYPAELMEACPVGAATLEHAARSPCGFDRRGG